MLLAIERSTTRSFGEMVSARSQASEFLRLFAGPNSSFYRAVVESADQRDLKIATGFVGAALEGFIQYVESGLYESVRSERATGIEGDAGVQRARKNLESLIADGKKFTYGNFASMGRYGLPEAYSSEFVAWYTRAKGAIESLFGSDSAPASVFNRGGQIQLIDNDSGKFELAMSHWLGALTAGLGILKEDAFGELVGNASAPGSFSNKVFVVHGRSEAAKNELEILIREFGLDPVVLHRQPDEGQTVIEKFEKHSDVGFVFVLLTPDEISYLRDEDSLPDGNRKKEFRARPNVIFEFGYFVGKLGRSRVCCIYTGDVTLPTDISGLLYKQFHTNIEEVGHSIRKELSAAGYSLK
jgi:predicted nucleotide-binding protein